LGNWERPGSESRKRNPLWACAGNTKSTDNEIPTASRINAKTAFFIKNILSDNPSQFFWVTTNLNISKLNLFLK
jgi:hypothetical protein